MNAIYLVALALIGCAQNPQESKTPAANRLNAFLAAFNSKDRSVVAKMIDDQFDPVMFKNRKSEEWVTMTVQMAENLAPLSVVQVKLSQPHATVAQCKSGAQGDILAIRIDCSPTPPHRIIGIRIDESADRLIAGENAPDFSGYTNLDDLAKRAVAGTKVPALAIAVMKDGNLQTGRSGVRKVGEVATIAANDRWNIGSNAKSMTAVLIAKLIEEGKLKWDSKLVDVLPGFPMKENYRAVTIEHLMQHIAGVQKDMTFTGSEVTRIVGSLKDPVEIRTAYVKDVLSREPIGKPGEKFAYSNAGYTMLGHIAERIEKKPFEALLAERVFNPLGMETAVVGQPGAVGMTSSPGQPHGHFVSGSNFLPGKLVGPINPMMAPAGGGVACSVEDLARYVNWHMRGELGEKVPLLKSETLKRLHTVLPRMSGASDYASGWAVSTQSGKQSLSHMGSDGSFVALMTFIPSEKLVVVVIANAGKDVAVEQVTRAILAREIKP